MNLFHFSFFLLVIFLLIGSKNFLDSVKSEDNFIFSLIKIFQAGHNFQKFIDIISNGFVSNFDVLLGVLQEFSNLVDLVVEISVHDGAIELIGVLSVAL